MLRCSNCGCEFSHPHIIKEYRGEYWGAPAYEDIGLCPDCGSEEWDEFNEWDEEEEEDEDEEIYV